MWFLYALLLLVLLWFWKTNSDKRKLFEGFNKLPGPKGLPIIGNMLDVGTNPVDILKNLESMRKKYGSIYRMWVGFTPYVVITDPKYHEQLMTSSVHVKKSSTYYIFHSWLGDGLISSNGGEKWKRHRRLLTPAFHFKILENFTTTFDQVAKRFIKKLDEHVDREAFDAFKLANLYTLDVFNQTSMGVDYHIQDNPTHEYITSLVHYEDMFIKRQFSLFGRNEAIYNLFPESKVFGKYVNKLKSFTEKLIHRRRAEKAGMKNALVTDEFGIKKRQTFIELMLDSELEDKHIREELDTFMFAGHDTTAAAVTFGLYELSNSREIQQRILEETNSIVGTDKSASITMDDLQNMSYIDCFAKEVLRKYPSVPYTERGIEDELYFDGVLIPKGSSVMFFTYGTHHDEKLYPDPEVFNPDRFLPENSINRHPFAYIPFNAGPRNCIGQKFAMLELKLTFAKVVRNFEILPAGPEHKLLLGATVIMKSVNGVYIRLRRRD